MPEPTCSEADLPAELRAQPQPRLDLRMPLLGCAAWAVGLVWALQPWLQERAIASPAWSIGLGVVGLGLLVTAGWLWRVARLRLLIVAAAVVGLAVVTSAQWTANTRTPAQLSQLAAQRASVTGLLEVTSDPKPIASAFGDSVVYRARLIELAGRGQSWRTGAAVVVFADARAPRPELGARLSFTGRLAPPQPTVFRPDIVAGLTLTGEPTTIVDPSLAWRVAAHARAAIRAAVAGRAKDQAALVPALVDGDDAQLSPALQDDFRTTGLTHLLAVSGTNLTLVAGALVLVARWLGVRGRWLVVVGLAGIVCFMFLARSEPSVLRAGAMGAVGLIGLGHNGRDRGLRALGVAMTGLVIVEPTLAVSAGFALSVLATMGLLLVAPPLRDQLATWLPRALAEAIAVPTAAQLACTPVVVGLSEQVSLVAVAANLLAAPAVAPATVLGLVGGLVALVWLPLGAMVATPAAWSVGWIIVVARRSAALPLPAIDWPATAVGLISITLATVGLSWWLWWLFRHRWLTIIAATALIAVICLGLPVRQDRDWLVVACDIGQGDALLLRAGSDSAVLVDAGPDPRLIDRCLKRYGVRSVPLIVLTHFHADHVDGLSGVLRGRTVGEVDVTGLAEPEPNAQAVTGALKGIRQTVTTAPFGVTRRVGAVRLVTLWPQRPEDLLAAPGPNNASVVLLAEIGGVRVLLTGDLEPEAQSMLVKRFPTLAVDVLKVPHHGSRYQDPALLTGLGATVAVISCGRDNDYGHPAPQTLGALREAGMEIRRTDQGGDVVLRPAEFAQGEP